MSSPVRQAIYPLAAASATSHTTAHCFTANQRIPLPVAQIQSYLHQNKTPPVPSMRKYLRRYLI